MRVYYQAATVPPADWESVDVVRDDDWRLVIPENLVAVNIQGYILQGHDHYALEVNDGVLWAYQWDDGPPDYDFVSGEIWQFYPPEVDASGRMNTKQHGLAYVDEAGIVIASPSGEYNYTYRPWSDFTMPRPEQVAHGLWLTDEEYQAHEAARSRHGWREWIDGR